jgi:hypothetical protein
VVLNMDGTALTADSFLTYGASAQDLNAPLVATGSGNGNGGGTVPTPEPSSVLLLGVGLLGSGIFQYQRRSAADSAS